ncbi:tRNA (adenosine(37)-N6)-threonylcarbamoyltransferase complex transferase subunit TsaD [Hydrogenobaculum acidophilum]
MSFEKENLCLGVETSCDDTALALYSDKRGLLDSLLSSQVNLHKEYNGIVPELCSREHTKNLYILFYELLEKNNVKPKDIDFLAVTMAPGLILSLLVGVSFASGFSYATSVPIVPVHHIEAHIYSVFLEYDVEYPFLALVISGGHTEIYLVKGFEEYELIGKTLDDAAGEAFDKGAVLLGLQYPGGPAIEKFLSSYENPETVDFPTPIKDDRIAFSFSGLKTFLRENVMRYPKEALAFSYQEAIVNHVIRTLQKAIQKTGVRRLVVVGGVAANKRLREKLKTLDVECYIPSIKYCTDNAAMVSLVGTLRFAKGKYFKKIDLHKLNPQPSLSLEAFTKTI